jgi:hypothetical protein
MIFDVRKPYPKDITGFSWDDSGDYLTVKHGIVELYSECGEHIASLTTVEDIENFITALRRAVEDNK